MASRASTSDLNIEDGLLKLSTDGGRSKAPARRPFRSDIQALRAVAVASVVIYHFWPVALPGGFVGVDIFFVISGYLISGHLIGEAERSGRIALLDFWARRIRRLLPAAFAVLVASLVALFALMPSVTWQDTLQEIAASAAYVQNWLLAYHAVDYLASENSATLAQHYWSLSVEEQFYLLWPLVLMVALAVANRVNRLSGRTAITIALAFIFVTSLTVSLMLTASQPSLAFFATSTRAWEFAAGGLVASLSTVKRLERFAAARQVAAWTGPIMIVFSISVINGTMPFPGWFALIPVIGAVLCISSGQRSDSWMTRRLVENPVTQWLGNYSYSIYLWHWPLIIITPWVIHGSASFSTNLFLVALTIALAFVTKQFVEDPIRTGQFWTKRRWPAYSLAASGMVILVAISIIGYAQVDRKNATEDALSLEKVMSSTPCFGALATAPGGRCESPYARPANLDTAFAAADVYAPAAGCQPGREVTVPVLCTFGTRTSPTRTIAVVGNSHAVRLMPALDLYGQKHGWKVLLLAKTDCMGLTTSAVGNQSEQDPCLIWSRNVQRDLLALPRLDAVVFASHVSSRDYLAGVSPSAEDLRNTDDQVLASWAAFVEHGTRVIVTEDVPGMRPLDGPECIARSVQAYDPCWTPRSQVVRANVMTELAQLHPDLVSYIPLNQYLCDSLRCHALIGGVIVYSDSHHLTTTFSRTLATYLGSSIASTIAR